MALLEPIPDKIPKGWKTMWQLEQETNISKSTLQRRLRKAGVKSKMFYAETPTGKRLVPYYFVG